MEANTARDNFLCLHVHAFKRRNDCANGRTNAAKNNNIGATKKIKKKKKNKPKWKNNNKWLKSVKKERDAGIILCDISMQDTAGINSSTCVGVVFFFSSAGAFSALILQLSFYVMRLVVDSRIMLFLSDKCEHYYCTKDSSYFCPVHTTLYAMFFCFLFFFGLLRHQNCWWHWIYQIHTVISAQYVGVKLTLRIFRIYVPFKNRKSNRKIVTMKNSKWFCLTLYVHFIQMNCDFILSI